MRVRVKERVRKKEQRKILGFLMLLGVNMEVKTRMRERKKGLRPRFLLILRVKLIVLRIEIPMAWGTTIDRLNLEINPFLYSRETKHLTLKDLDTYLIPDG